MKLFKLLEKLGPENATADVTVVDADGFIHVPMDAYWSAEENCWVIQTRWTAPEGADAA